MSQGGNTRKPGTLIQAIINDALDDGLIAGQGQKVTVTGSGNKNTPPMPAGLDDDDEFQKTLRLLEAGFSVDQSIYNKNSKNLVIVGQGQRSHLHGVEINRGNNTEAQQTQEEEDHRRKLAEEMSYR